MRIYIDYITSLITRKKGTKVVGGVNYTKRLIRLLAEAKQQEQELIVLWPKDYEPIDDSEEAIYHNNNLIIREVKTFSEVSYSQDDVLFVTQGSGQVFRDLCRLFEKEILPQIYITIHDRRHNDFIYDHYDNYYFKGYKKLAIYQYLIRKSRDFAFDYYYKKASKYFQKVFTVSNYSLQALSKYGNYKSISWYYQGIDYVESPIKYTIREKYILFVGGHRPEKNFLRTLEAFCSYKEEINDELYLYVTGLEDDLLNRFCKLKFINSSIVKRWVKKFGYVSDQELSDMYRQCEYVLFTSKNEGFGLPVLEAMYYYKPILASNQTSIPEVAGCAAKYVNPYSSISIKEGMKFYGNQKNKKKSKNLCKKRLEIVKKIIEMDTNVLVNEILEIYELK